MCTSLSFDVLYYCHGDSVKYLLTISYVDYYCSSIIILFSPSCSLDTIDVFFGIVGVCLVVMVIIVMGGRWWQHSFPERSTMVPFPLPVLARTLGSLSDPIQSSHHIHCNHITYNHIQSHYIQSYYLPLYIISDIFILLLLQVISRTLARTLAANTPSENIIVTPSLLSIVSRSSVSVSSAWIVVNDDNNSTIP